MKSRSASLFHFTKNFDILCSILKEGFWPRYSLEDVSWIGDTEFFAFPVVCFCDIPLTRLSEHTSFYGKFGIGLKQDWGIKEKLNPVIYLSKSSYLYKTVRNIFYNPNPETEHSKSDIVMTLAHCKPMAGHMKVSGQIIQKIFMKNANGGF